MTQRRSLALKRETLTVLSDADIASVVGAQALPTLVANCVTQQVRCITDADHSTCLNCE
ncbi:MAG: hypothetical protein QOE45_2271 [Frankiaceae bacterium]|jgi:hypothetical protein|nr:hypothetical protein [Frankiaceae bacterium]